MPPIRTRLALALLSAAALALELALMRLLSLRYWHHFAYMAIGVALLGFGASGTAVTLLRRQMRRRLRPWLMAACAAFAVSVPWALWAAQGVPLDVQWLAWSWGQVGYVALFELLLFVPFLFAGAAVCVALLDEPAHVSGHYAANMVGSGVGAIGTIGLMHVLPTPALLAVLAAAGFAAGLLLVRWRRMGQVLGMVAAGAAAALPVWLGKPFESAISPYKRLAYELRAGAEVTCTAEGPMGRVDVLAGPMIHHHPGLSLQYGLGPDAAAAPPVPPHVLMILDGDQTMAVYDARRPEDWTFLDWTTAAVGYAVRLRPSVLLVGAGGGADIGLALYHDSPSVTALEINPQVIEVMTGPLADRGGAVYRHQAVRVLEQEARGFLSCTGERYDLIQVPPIDAFGASGAGLYSTQESYLYTVESLALMLGRLQPGGLLCMTRWARTPPRDGLRILDTAAEALRSRGLEPAPRIAMIRSYATITLLAGNEPLGQEAIAAVWAFCNTRGFDLCHLPGMTPQEANRFHRLEEPIHFLAAEALLGPGRETFLRQYHQRYGFQIDAPTDDRPFYFHFGAPRAEAVRAAPGAAGADNRMRAFQETGNLMLLAALLQAALLGAVLIVVPLAPGATRLRRCPRKAACLGYFLLIGAGFMLLEMGLLQKLVLYLAHPIYSAAVVICAFLVFGGVGSLASRFWPPVPRRVAMAAGGAVAVMAVGYLAGMDHWLRATQAAPLAARFAIAAASIAPLAFAMGHMLPSAVRQLVGSADALVPWGWAANGFASVIATVGAPLLAMQIGFTLVTCLAAACYAAAAVMSCLLPAVAARPDRGRPGCRPVWP